MTQHSSIDTLIDSLIAREGGYVDHPADRGGPTRYGVTEAVARAHGYAGAMADFPRSEAERIYRLRYWTRPGFDRVAAIAPAIAAELFDTGVNMGPAIAVGFLQRALNVLNRGARDFADLPATAKIDAATLTALGDYVAKRGQEGIGVLTKALDALQGERYIHLAEQRPANEAFVYGWLSARLG